MLSIFFDYNSRVWFHFAFRLPEHPNISKKIVKQTGYEQSCQVTPYYIPTKNPFKEQQEQHLDQESGYG
jgi:hypothetical protein